MVIQEPHLRKSIQIAHLVRMSLILASQRRREEESQLGFSIRTVEDNVPTISSEFLKVVLESYNDM